MADSFTIDDAASCFVILGVVVTPVLFLTMMGILSLSLFIWMLVNPPAILAFMPEVLFNLFQWGWIVGLALNCLLAVINSLLPDDKQIGKGQLGGWFFLANVAWKGPLMYLVVETMIGMLGGVGLSGVVPSALHAMMVINAGLILAMFAFVVLLILVGLIYSAVDCCKKSEEEEVGQQPEGEYLPLRNAFFEQPPAFNADDVSEGLVREHSRSPVSRAAAA